MNWTNKYSNFADELAHLKWSVESNIFVNFIDQQSSIYRFKIIKCQDLEKRKDNQIIREL